MCYPFIMSIDTAKKLGVKGYMIEGEGYKA